MIDYEERPVARCFITVELAIGSQVNSVERTSSSCSAGSETSTGASAAAESVAARLARLATDLHPAGDRLGQDRLYESPLLLLAVLLRYTYCNSCLQ